MTALVFERNTELGAVGLDLAFGTDDEILSHDLCHAQLAQMLAGKLDAQVSDSTAAIYMGRQNPRLAAMSPDKVFHPIYVAILLRRDDQTLLNYINIWLDQIELDGTLGKIRTKWLGDTR